MRNPNSRVSDPSEFVTSPGSSVRVLYSSRVYKDGRIDLTANGTEDIQEQIDSYRDTTDMAYILHQLSIGNEAVLNQRSPMYGDFTAVPRSLAEAQQMLIDGEDAFMRLPLETRQQFDNDFRRWLFESGSAEWMRKMSPVTGSAHLDNPVESVDAVPVSEEDK